jgi:large subunit ribosomal protein L19
MTSLTLHTQAKRFTRKVPAIEPGFTVRVHERIQEGNKQRVQVFEGLVISTHNGHVPTDASFTVRRIVSGIGVEKVFPVHSPVIEKIEVKKVAKVRRAKLFFLRGRSGKSARLSERFTTEGEYGVPADEQPEEVAELQETDIVAEAEKTEESDTPAATEEAEEKQAS